MQNTNDDNVVIYEGRYKDQACIVLENEALAVRVLPRAGGKIQSVFVKDQAKELLYQSPGDIYKTPAYSRNYEDCEFSGFDEMFPTIDKCFYPSDPWRGIEVPDHGEVWTLPWDFRVRESWVFLSVHGVRFPYRFEKKVALVGDRGVRCSYRLINDSSFDLHYIWAAHPLFNCIEGMRIILPQSVDRIINTAPGARMGGFGQVYEWPKPQGGNSLKLDLDRVGSPALRRYAKFYALGKVAEGWCALRDEMSGETIGLSYPPLQVPYLGLWINEGGLAGQYNIALEPCTGALDNLATSVNWGQAALLAAKSEQEWFLNLSFAKTDVVHSVEQDGRIV